MNEDHKNETLERAWANVNKIEESKAALEERRLLNAMHPEWMKYEPAPKAVPDVVRKTRDDAIFERAPCGCNAAPAPDLHEQLQAVLEDLAECFGTALGEVEKRVAKLEEKKNE